MDNLLKHFEKYISLILIVIASLFVCYQVLDMVFHFVLKIAASIRDHTFYIEEKGKPVAGMFFSILLTMEIIQTLKVFAHGHDVKVKIILIVSLIAVTRKIITLDICDATPNSELAVAFLILSLAISYYLVSRSKKTDESS